MSDFSELTAAIVNNWPVWLVTVTLVVAAVIDGWKLKVPNWITFPMIISGWVYSAAFSPFAFCPKRRGHELRKKRVAIRVRRRDNRRWLWM